jgi:hypothetical protein
MNETNINSEQTSVWSILTMIATEGCWTKPMGETCYQGCGASFAVLVLVVSFDQKTVNSRNHTGLARDRRERESAIR